jgi:hypothetical protein
MLHVRVLCCDACGWRREDIVDEPWRYDSGACYCGCPEYSVDFEFIRNQSCWSNPDEYFPLSTAAEILEMGEAELLDLCEKGLIDSILEEALSGEPLRLFESVAHFQAHGPNELMTFDQAMAYIADSSPALSRYVRRPSWRGESCVGWGEDAKSDPPNTSLRLYKEMELYTPLCCLDPYCPTEEDRRATDWFICGR